MNAKKQTVKKIHPTYFRNMKEEEPENDFTQLYTENPKGQGKLIKKQVLAYKKEKKKKSDEITEQVKILNYVIKYMPETICSGEIIM